MTNAVQNVEQQSTYPLNEGVTEPGQVEPIKEPKGRTCALPKGKLRDACGQEPEFKREQWRSNLESKEQPEVVTEFSKDWKIFRAGTKVRITLDNDIFTFQEVKS